MQCPYPRRLKPIYPDYPDGLEVPCGKCILCRKQKSFEWSLRMFHELSTSDKSSFITLTYADQYLPANGTLVKPHVQLFMKRLRKRFDTPIRYFLCGEYGEKSSRPHYHAILYGVGLTAEERFKVMDSWSYCDWHNPSIRHDSFGLVESASIQYVSGYIQKKLYGETESLLYASTGRISPFKLCSQGIGREYADKYAESLKTSDILTMRGIPHTMPRYYIKRLNLDVNRIKQNAIDKDCKITEKYTGLYVSSDELYKSADKEVLTYFFKDNEARKQKEHNYQAKCKLNERSL